MFVSLHGDDSFEKQSVFQPVNEFSVIYGTWSSIAVFTKAHRAATSCATLNQSIFSHPTFLIPVLTSPNWSHIFRISDTNFIDTIHWSSASLMFTLILSSRLNLDLGSELSYHLCQIIYPYTSQYFIMNSNYKITSYMNIQLCRKPEKYIDKKSVFVLLMRVPRLTAVGIRCAVHTTPSIRKSWH
jgi:hypothetical protein